MASMQPDDFHVMQKLKQILEESDLTKLTRKEVRKQLEQKLGGNFSSPQWKAKIKHEIEEFVRNKENGVDTHSNALPTKAVPSSNGAAYSSPNKKRKLNNGNVQNDEYTNNDINNNQFGRQPRLGSNRSSNLIQRSTQDSNSYFIKLPGDGARKRCIMHMFKRKLYVGFREYYEKGGEEKPTKKGCNLSQEQWEFVVKHIDEINEQLKRMKRY